jgi:hypothetical protein
MPDKAIMDELTEAVGRTANLSNEQAAKAVAGMLRFFASRMPSPLFGQFQEHLNPGLADASSTASPAPWA